MAVVSSPEKRWDLMALLQAPASGEAAAVVQRARCNLKRKDPSSAIASSKS